MISFEVSSLYLGVVGEMNSSSRSVARGRSSRHGRSRGRGTHHSPPLVHAEDPIQEEARGNDNIQQHTESEEPVTRDLVREILECLHVLSREHHSEHGDR